MVIFLYGEDGYRRAQRVQVLRDAFVKKFDSSSVSTSEIAGTNFSIDEFRKAIRSGGLFTQKRFVVLTDVWHIPSDTQKQLAQEFDSISADTILCISAETPPRKDNALFKRLLTVDTVEAYTALTQTQLRGFIQKTCTKLNATIDSRATEKLMVTFGNDLWALTHEIHKLANYSKQITTDTLAIFIDEALNDNIFHLTDALGNRNAKRATELLHDQFDSGANAQYLIAMLGRHIGTLLKVKKTAGRGLKLHSFVLEKSLAQAKRFSEQELDSLYWRLLEIDQKLKTSNTSTPILLDLYIIDICQTKTPA
ncbi:MAG: DNA polymerase III subunit delta [Candidatus Kerfeldbacteria bacterium]|nr:DNA polymerase III subunit delta [Candidatus Kerfeldbacteria bacterium]